MTAKKIRGSPVGSSINRASFSAIQRQPGANTISTVDAVRHALPQFETILPDSIQMDILYDRSESIRASIHDVQFTLLLSCAGWCW